MDYKQTAIEAAANKATVITSSTAIFLGLTANEVAALGGLLLAIVVGIGNLAINWHFKSQHLKLAIRRAAHDEESGDD